MILITSGINQIQILVEIYSPLPITRTLATAVARTLRYNQLQKYLRHCTVFWHKWTVHDLMPVIPPSPLIKVASNTRSCSNLGGTTLNGREEGGQYYISQTCDQQRFEARKVVFSLEGFSYREQTVLVFLCCQKFVRIKICKIRMLKRKNEQNYLFKCYLLINFSL